LSIRTQLVTARSRAVALPPEVREGTNFLYKNSAISLLLCMNRFRSTKFSKILRLILFAAESFEQRLASLDSSHCLTSEELSSSGLLKKKHYYYGAYLSALTSIPMLSPSADCTQALYSMVAKTSAITSIKVLDNINDQLRNKQEAVESQRKHLRAFTRELFNLDYEEGFMRRAENSCMNMARWTFELVNRGLRKASEMLRIYRRDFEDYIDGQMKSIDEKANGSTPTTTIRDYLQKVNEKSVGKIWVDIDFCFLEKALGGLDQSEFKAVLGVRRAADCFFKGCNLYDDIADLEEDLRLGIFNSVPLLALDRGMIDESDLKRNGQELLGILKQSDVINEVVQLGDLIFLQGIKPLTEAKELTKVIDIDAIVFGAKVLRMFAIRKWLFHERSLNSICKTAISLGSLGMYRISDPIAAYAKYI